MPSAMGFRQEIESVADRRGAQMGHLIAGVLWKAAVMTLILQITAVPRAS
jgi:hypothetical protein